VCTTTDEKDTGEQMEWEPTTQVASGKAPSRRTRPSNRPQAKWVSQKVIEGRRENQECLRCGGDDHFVRECRYSPPERPERSEPRQNKSAASIPCAPEGALPTNQSASSKARKKKAPAPAQVKEVEGSK